MQMPPTYSSQDPDLINVIIETPRGTRSKYTYEPESGLYKLKRITPPDTLFPLDFGFIPGTKGEDGDPLDALVFMDEPGFPGCLLECRLIGVTTVRHRKKGEWMRNDRFLAVADASGLYGHLREITDVDSKFLDSLDHFFSYYHSIEGNEYVPLERLGAGEARRLIS